MQTKLQLTGIGLRPAHISSVLEQKPKVAWLEVHSENYFCQGGTALKNLLEIRKHYPISLHGVSLSLGSTDEINWQHVQQLQTLIDRVEPCLVSDHLAWVSVEGRYLHDLLPLPYTQEALRHVVQRIDQVQQFLKRQLLIENISSYVSYEESEYTEWQFLQEVAQQSGCGLLLDINNIYVNASNLNFDPQSYLKHIKKESINEIHLGGFSTVDLHGKQVLIDTHAKPIMPAVWSLFKTAIEYYGPKPTIIEWDKDLPTLETLCLEAYRAEKIVREIYVPAKRTA